MERVCAASIARAPTNAPASATSDALQDTRAGMVAPTWRVGGARRCAAAAAGTTARASRTAVVRAMQARSRKARSEEHTSELQSRLHLVCRLLLEKKKSEHVCVDAYGA